LGSLDIKGQKKMNTPQGDTEGILKSMHMLINGEWVEAQEREVFEIENPAKRLAIASVPRARARDVDDAVDAAEAAFPRWRRIPPRERGKALSKIANELIENSETIAQILAEETGNAIRTQSRPEVGVTAEIFQFFSGLGSELKGETVPISSAMLNYTVREPLGVVGAIIPWNAPLALAALKIAPALLAGNTVVLKTAESAPLAVLLLAEICNQHLPKGAINVLTGFGLECGAPLMAHSKVRKLTFTGSTATGKSIMESAAKKISPVSLELGGKSPNIVFPDVDEDWVVDGAIAAARIYRQSQSCTTGSRLFIHESIFESFLDKLVKKLSSLKIGDPLEEDTDVGCLASETQFNRVCSYIKEGLNHPSAKILTGGLPDLDGPLSEGYFLKPTIFTGISNDFRLAREEIFGPVICAIPWSTEDEVINMANDSEYGLGAFIWTRDIGRALRTAHSIDSGFVQINQGLGQFPGQSYGGMKKSGIGSEYSLESMIESYTTRKTVNINVNTPE